MTTLEKFKYEAGIYQPGEVETNVISTIVCNSLATALSVDEVTNDEAEGDLNSNIPIRVINRRRAYGISCRYVVICRLVGSAPNTLRKYARVPVFQQAVFEGYISSINPSISYAGNTTWEFVNGLEEKYHLAYGPSST